MPDEIAHVPPTTDAPPAPGGRALSDVWAVFAQLAGEWALQRTISGLGSMRGQAVFTPLRPGVLHYREDGRLELASGHSGDAHREYFYLLEDDHIHVAFADAPPGERTFLRLRPHPVNGSSGSQAHDTHYCGRDAYTATFTFTPAGRLVVTMAVRGPAKDYVIHTELTRHAPAPGRPWQ